MFEEELPNGHFMALYVGEGLSDVRLAVYARNPDGSIQIHLKGSFEEVIRELSAAEVTLLHGMRLNVEVPKEYRTAGIR